MFGWAVGFFIAALVAAVFGFGGVATAFTSVAIILFWAFLALFVLSLIGALARRTQRKRTRVRRTRADRGRRAPCICVDGQRHVR